MSCESILNVLALVLVPIIAVLIGQYLQDRSKKREAKMQIFKVLMASRAIGWTNASVEALNIIDIVFADDKKVIEQWKNYYDKLCITNPTENDSKKIGNSRDKLLEAIAISLGYKDKITWETIQSPYIPRGLVEAMEKQQQYQDAQTNILEIANAVMKKATGENHNGKDET